MKKALWVLIALIIIGGIIYMVRRSDNTPDISWSFQEQTPEPITGTPLVQVTVTVDGVDYDAGIYNGSCVEIDEENLPGDELAGIVCWWAGFGDEIGVFSGIDSYIVKHGEIQEGDEGAAPSRGNFTTLFEIAPAL